ncbi:MAG TPA: YtxH domain-containing protein [Galbitalea sp.]|nr:YtxH domain-containing protein [Galbitalea sp.]
MKGKILLVVGLGVGYVLGSRAGREKYDELVGKVQKFWNDPRVQTQVGNAQDFVKEKAPDVADFLSSTVKKAAPKSSPAKTSTAKASAAGKPAARTSPTTRSTTAKS